jgi:hypothetical protein
MNSILSHNGELHNFADDIVLLGHRRSSVPTKDMGDKKCVHDFSRGVSCTTVHKMTEGTKDHIPWQVLNHYTLDLLADISVVIITTKI